MNNKKDYYKILGITDEEKQLQGKEFEAVLKKRHRKLALSLHPDKQQGKSETEKKANEEKFKEVSEAYEVLSDSKKRQEYDNPMSGFSGFGGFSGFDPFDMMSDFGFGGQKRERVVKGQSLRIVVGVTLEEIYDGSVKTIKYTRNGTCKKCGGSGKSAHTTVEACPHCGGTGQIFSRNGFMQTITTCPHCGGKGNFLKNPCNECKGSGVSQEEMQVNITIPKGIVEGVQMTMNGYGCAPLNGNGVFGDLLIVFKELNHEKFERIDNDLIFELEIPVLDALLGGDIEVTTINGKRLTTKISPLIADGTHIRFGNKGMPIYGQNGKFGSMIGIVKFVMPKKLNEEEKSLLLELKNKENFQKQNVK